MTADFDFENLFAVDRTGGFLSYLAQYLLISRI
jgi:hypothetical protein